MKRRTPNERELTDLVAQAFEQLPEPDARRLAAIEQRLLDRSGTRGRSKLAWWWLAGALVAGAASALWWAVNYDSADRESVSPAVTSPAPEQPAPPVTPSGKDSKPAGEPAPKPGPMIYRKEN